MTPFFSDPILDTVAALGYTVDVGGTSAERGEEAFNKMLPALDEGFKNLSVKDIVKELSTVASAYAFDDEYFDFGENSTDSYRPVSARVETFVMSAVLGLIFIVGVLGNGTLIAIFLRHRGMRNIPNT